MAIPYSYKMKNKGKHMQTFSILMMQLDLWLLHKGDLSRSQEILFQREVSLHSRGISIIIKGVAEEISGTGEERQSMIQIYLVHTVARLDMFMMIAICALDFLMTLSSLRQDFEPSKLKGFQGRVHGVFRGEESEVPNITQQKGAENNILDQLTKEQYVELVK